jgi:hypothetical protein
MTDPTPRINLRAFALVASVFRASAYRDYLGGPVPLIRMDEPRPHQRRPNKHQRWKKWRAAGRRGAVPAAALALFALLSLAGCQSYQATFANGTTVRVDRFLTDAEAGRIAFNPQTGEITVENLKSEVKLAETIDSLANAVAKKAPAP